MIIYGWKQYAQVLAVLQLVCSQCGIAGDHVLRKLTTKFTLFWIPLFPINKKRTLFCTSCQCEQKVPKEQALQLIAAAEGAAPQPAGPAYGDRPVYGPGAPFTPPGATHQPGPVPGYGPPAAAPSGPQPVFSPPSSPQPAFAPQPGQQVAFAPQPAFGPPAPGYGPPSGPQPQPYPQQHFPGPGHPPRQPYPPQGYPPPGYPQR